MVESPQMSHCAQTLSWEEEPSWHTPWWGLIVSPGVCLLTQCLSFPQIHSRYEGKKTSKHKRNLAITGGVTLSVIASPVIAAVSVGKQALRGSLPA